MFIYIFKTYVTLIQNNFMDTSIEEFGTEIPTKVSFRPAEPDLFTRNDNSNDDSENFNISFTQWTLHGPNTYVSVPPTKTKLPPGLYDIEVKNGTLTYCKADLKVDNLMEFPDSVSDSILKEIDSFWTKEAIFKEYGFLHRRGYLLYGPQGSGKTAIVQQVISKIIITGGIIFCCGQPQVLAPGLSIFRQIEPDRPVVCLFEDIDAIIQTFGEDKILALLDGEEQIDKVLNIATTNYPEKLNKRIVSRPRRFDRVLKIGMPNDAVRKVYFADKLNIKENELDKWVKATDGFSFAACAELVISVKCLGHSFEEAFKILKKMMTHKVSSVESEFTDEPAGFAAGTKR